MNPLFVMPPHEHVNHGKYKDHTNPAINLSRVSAMFRSRKNYYPDNTGIPTIIFEFNGKEAAWYFDEDSHRDDVFIELLEISRNAK